MIKMSSLSINNINKNIVSVIVQTARPNRKVKIYRKVSITLKRSLKQIINNIM